MRRAGGLGLVAALAWPAVAAAETYEVGPGKAYTELADVADLLAPGDVVLVDGDHTYAPVDFDVDGTAAAPITIRGVPVGGKRPVIAGGEYTVMLRGNHYLFEGFEVTAGGDATNYICVLHKADQIVIRDVVVHDCPNHGILGTDLESGSLTIEYSEVYRCGEGTQHHQIYISTDEGMYPGSVFRLQHTYVHDATGGNNVKSRAERNEIYYNWIEGAEYHELDLIGSEEYPEPTAREDSDVVGNVLIKSSDYQIARIGGDGTGETNGRYRFVNNTFVLGPGDLAIRAQDGIESIELSNNVVVRDGGGTVRLLRDTDAAWAGGGATVFGTSNWVPSGSDLPDGLESTIEGASPGFVDLAGRDLRPAEGSPLLDVGAAVPPPFAGHELPRAEVVPLYLPPFGVKLETGGAEPRPAVGSLDLGAFELGSGPPIQPPGGGGGNGDGDTGGGCGCRAGGGGARGGAAGLALLLLAMLPLRRRR